MGMNYEKETLISGYYFEPFDGDSFLIDGCDPGAKLIYMDEGFDKESFYRIRKMLQMLAISYRLVMISKMVWIQLDILYFKKMMQNHCLRY